MRQCPAWAGRQGSRGRGGQGRGGRGRRGGVAAFEGVYGGECLLVAGLPFGEGAEGLVRVDAVGGGQVAEHDE